MLTGLKAHIRGCRRVVIVLPSSYGGTTVVGCTMDSNAVCGEGRTSDRLAILTVGCY
jgi:hypothetical protein